MKDNKIWFLWYQGIEEMPKLVKMCYESWEMLNPDFDLVFLNQNNIQHYIEIDSRITDNENISIQSLSDVIRINLLSEHGGVWVDATCYCVQPLSSWLPNYFSTGFFAFSSPGPDRMMSNWFMAAERQNVIAAMQAKTVNQYWINNPEIKRARQLPWYRKILYLGYLSYVRTLSSLNILKTTSHWFSFFPRKVIKTYPYFCFHYMFRELYDNNGEFRKLWDSTPKFDASVPHRIKHFGLNNRIEKGSLKKEIENKEVPIYKLCHKTKLDESIQDSAINHLMKQHQLTTYSLTKDQSLLKNDHLH